MPTLFNPFKPYVNTAHVLDSKDQHKNLEISNEQHSKISEISSAIKESSLPPKADSSNKKFSATSLDLSRKTKDDDFCIQTYLEQRKEYTKKFEEEKATWKTPAQAFFQGAAKGLFLAVALCASYVALALVAKKIMASALILNLVQNNQRFFKA